VASLLRAEGLSVRAELAPRKLGRSLETASKEHAHFAVIIGDELDEGNVQLKDLEAGTQRLVPLADLARELARAAKSHHHG
jgi:histidyl-tRNA synthetase